MKFSSPVVAESHYQGKVHAKNLRLKSTGPQTPCVYHQCASGIICFQFPFPFSVIVGFPVAFQTPAAVQARKKPAEDPSSTLAGDGGGGGGGGDDNDSNRFCSMCQASFNNPLMAQQHYVGKKHRKQMTKMKLMETYGPATAPGQSARPPRGDRLSTIPRPDSLLSPASSFHAEGLPVHHLQDWAQLCGAVPVSHQWCQTQQPVSTHTHRTGHLMRLSHSDVFLSLLIV